MIIFVGIFVFLFGLIVGSFLNVLIDRLPQEKSPWVGRSKCDYCKTPLSPFDLIPVFSFIFLGGKCRYCHKKLSFQYPFIEFITGLMFVGLFIYNFQFSIFNFQSTNNFQFAFSLITYYLSLITIFSSMLVIFIADLKYQIIPDEMLVSLGVGILIMLIINYQLSIINYLLSGFGAGLFFLAIYLITKGKGMGFGDVKLAPVLGLFLGFPKTITALYLAFLTGAIFSIILVLIGKKKWKSKIAFGPFLIIGAIVSFFAGDLITKWYLSFFI